MPSFTSPNRRLVIRVAVIGLISAAMGAVAGLIAYWSGREMQLQTILQYNQFLARNISQSISDNWDDPQNPQPLTHAATVMLERWRLKPADQSDAFVCLIGPNGRLVAHSDHPGHVGQFVGNVRLSLDQSTDQIVSDLIAKGQDWCGENISFAGQRQLAAYAYNDKLRSLVMIQVPAPSYQRALSQTMSPWAITSLLTTLILWPTGIFLVSLVFFRNKRELERASAQLDSQYRELEHLYEAAPVGLALLDRDLHIVRINSKLARVARALPAELIGRSIFQVVPQFADRIAPALLDVLQSGEPHLNLEISAPDQGNLRGRTAIVNYYPLRDGHQKTVGVGVVVQDITARKNTESALQKSESMFRVLVENDYDIITLLDAEGKLKYASPAFERTLGHATSHWIGQSVLPLLHPEDAERVNSQLRKAIDQPGNVIEFTERLRHKDGRYRTFLVICTNRLHEPTIAAMVAIFRDITDRALAESLIKKSERRFRSIFEQAAVGVALIETASDRILRVNDKYAEIFGRSTSDLIGRSLSDLTVPDSHEPPESSELPRPQQHREIRMVNQFDQPVWLEITRSRTWHEEGVGPVHVEIAVDVSMRREAELELAASEERFRTLCANAPVGIFITDSTGKFTYVNRRFRSITGLDSRHVFEQDWSAHIHPADRYRVRSEWSTALSEGRIYSATYRFQIGQGKITWVHEESVPFVDAHGNSLGYLRTLVDISDERNYQQALEVSEKRYRTLVENAPEAIVVFDVDAGTLVDFNDNALRLFGMDAAALRRSSPIGLSPPYQPNGQLSADLAAEYLHQSLQGQSPSFEWTHIDGQGREIPCEVCLVRLPSRTRRLVRGSIVDVSQKIAAETATREQHRQLAHVSRLSVMGEMVASISHEINQPLSSIANFSNAIQRLLSSGRIDNENVRDWTKEIYDQAARAADIIRRIGAFVRKDRADFVVFDVHELIIETLGLLTFQARNLNILMETRFAEQPLHIQANRIQIQQVLVNLLRNAIEAVENGNAADDRWVWVSTSLKDDRVVIQVSDNGPGILWQHRDKLFAPFFTTKQDGMGMGLAISRTIIEDHEGHLFVQNSRLEQPGATFGICLPVWRECHVRTHQQTDCVRS